jgi:chromosome segregation ATPase
MSGDNKFWRATLDSFGSVQEKFEYLTGLSNLSWDDCCDAWFEAKKLIPEVAAENARLKSKLAEKDTELKKLKESMLGNKVNELIMERGELREKLAEKDAEIRRLQGESEGYKRNELAALRKLAEKDAELERLKAECSSWLSLHNTNETCIGNQGAELKKKAALLERVEETFKFIQQGTICIFPGHTINNCPKCLATAMHSAIRAARTEGAK